MTDPDPWKKFQEALVQMAADAHTAGRARERADVLVELRAREPACQGAADYIEQGKHEGLAAREEQKA